MVSKNNIKNRLAADAKRVPHYGIRKLSIGVASVLLSTTLYLGGVNAQASTTESTNNNQSSVGTDNQNTQDATAIQQKQVTLNSKASVNSSSTQSASSQGQAEQTANSSDSATQTTTTVNVSQLSGENNSLQGLEEEKIPVTATNQTSRDNGVSGQSINTKNQLKLKAQANAQMSISVSGDPAGNVKNYPNDASTSNSVFFPNATESTGTASTNGGVTSSQSQAAINEAKNAKITVTYTNLTGDTYNGKNIAKIVLEFSNFALNTADPANLYNGEASYAYAANRQPVITFDKDTRGFDIFKMNGVTVTYHFYDDNGNEITFDPGTAYLEAASLNHNKEVVSHYPTTKSVADHVEKEAPVSGATTYRLVGSSLLYHYSDKDSLNGTYNNVLYSDEGNNEDNSNGVMEIQNGASIRYYLANDDSSPSAWIWNLSTDIPNSTVTATKAVNEVIHYQTKEGITLAPDKTQSTTVNGYSDVDGLTKWDTASLPSVVSPTVSGYTASDTSIPTITVTNSDAGNNTGLTVGTGQTNATVTEVDLNSSDTSTPTVERTVIYTPDQQKLTVKFIDDTTDTTLKTVSETGKSDSNSGYSTQDDIAKYEKDGYTLVSDDSDSSNGDDIYFDDEDTVDQNYKVHLKHTIVPVTPSTPKTQSNGVDPTKLIKNVTETITYTGMDSGNPAPKSQTLPFVGSGYYDAVTKKWTDVNGKELKDASGNDVTADNGGITWTHDNGTTFDAVTTPDESTNGYYIKSVSSHEDPSKPGSVAAITGINHNSDDINITVTYAPTTKNVTVKFIDDTTGTTLNTVEKKDGKSDTDTGYNTKTDIQNYENQGYQLVSDATNGDDLTYNGQTYEVHLKHQIKPVTPDTPSTQSNGVNPATLTKKVTETITYTGMDSGNPSPVSKSITFTGSGYYDAVTKKWTDKDGKELKDTSGNDVTAERISPVALQRQLHD